MEERNEVSPFLRELLESGVAMECAAPGVVIWSEAFQAVIAGIDRMIRLARPESAIYETLRPSPIMSRADFERSGYLYHFPHLAGTVHAFLGGEAEHDALLTSLRAGESWDRSQKLTNVVLTPASCYPVYPMLSRRGSIAKGGYLADVKSYCYRHEPSLEAFRLQSFQMHEFVCVAPATNTLTFLDDWKHRALLLASELLLPVELESASDAFFGRKGELAKAHQRTEALKHELTVPLRTGIRIACASFNYHHETFSLKWDLRFEDRQLAQSACVGFGLERLALGLYARHGTACANWPVSVRSKLGLNVDSATECRSSSQEV